MDADARTGETKTWQQTLTGIFPLVDLISFLLEFIFADAQSALTKVKTEIRNIESELD